MQKDRNERKLNERVSYLKIVEYTSQRIPPVQYINISVFSLSTFAKGSEAMSWTIRNRDKMKCVHSHCQKNKFLQLSPV